MMTPFLYRASKLPLTRGIVIERIVPGFGVWAYLGDEETGGQVTSFLGLRALPWEARKCRGAECISVVSEATCPWRALFPVLQEAL
jgi:hypothetical protein